MQKIMNRQNWGWSLVLQIVSFRLTPWSFVFQIKIVSVLINFRRRSLTFNL